MTNGGPIKVDFPDKIRVTSPEIDSIKTTAERISNWLHEDFKRVIAPLQVLNKLEEMLTAFKETLVKQFEILFSSQMEANVVSRQANIRAIDQKIKFVEEHITKKKDQFGEAQKRIFSRYNKLAETMVEQHTRYLKQLDQHIYEITEKIYPNQIQEKFSFTSIPSQQYLVAHTLDTILGRSACLNAGYENTKNQLQTFLELRKPFHDELEQITTKELKAGNYEIIFWFVELEDIETKTKRIEVFFEWEINGSLPPLDHEQISNIKNIAKNLVKKAISENISNEDQSFLVDQLKKTYRTPEDEVKRFKTDCKNILIA